LEIQSFSNSVLQSLTINRVEKKLNKPHDKIVRERRVMRTATKRKLLVEGLTSGQQYVFKMAAGGSDPNRTWTDEIASYIL